MPWERRDSELSEGRSQGAWPTSVRLLVMDVYHKWFLISKEFVFSSDLLFKESRLDFQLFL